MLKNILKNKSLKYISFWLLSASFCLLFKYSLNLPGNIDLIWGIQLLLAQIFGPIALGLWSATTILGGDLLADNWGTWSIVTSISYFLVSCLTSALVKTKNYSFINSLIFTVLVTIFYDLLTASTGPLFFEQAWLVMLIGQVPFSLVHMVSNCASTSLIYSSIQFLAMLKITHHGRINCKITPDFASGLLLSNKFYSKLVSRISICC